MNWLHRSVLVECSHIQAKRLNAPSGLRDESLLDSALERPKQYLHYNPSADVFDLAAEYAYGLIKNHPFVDGNKRVAYIACCVFLKVNNMSINASKIQKIHTINQLASTQISASDFAEFLRKNAVELN